MTDAERRLAELDRGRRAARVAEAVRTSRFDRMTPGLPEQATLADAEATLARLRDRQSTAASSAEFFDGITIETRPQTIDERLEDSGFGPPTRPTAAAILARLKLPATP